MKRFSGEPNSEFTTANHAGCEAVWGELAGAGHVADGVDVRVTRLRVVVHLDGATLARADAELLETEARDVGLSSDRDDDLVEGQANRLPVPLGDERAERVRLAARLHRDRVRAGEHVQRRPPRSAPSPDR